MGPTEFFTYVKIDVAGIRLVDITSVLIVSPPDMRPISGCTQKTIAQALDCEPAVIDLYLGDSGQPTMGFVIPVYLQVHQHRQTYRRGTLRTIAFPCFWLIEQPSRQKLMHHRVLLILVECLQRNNLR